MACPQCGSVLPAPDGVCRELLLARQITHKHVVRIHDFGEVAGVKYLTMPCIEGETLAARLRRDGRLPLRDALDDNCCHVNQRGYELLADAVARAVTGR